VRRLGIEGTEARLEGYTIKKAQRGETSLGRERWRAQAHHRAALRIPFEISSKTNSDIRKAWQAGGWNDQLEGGAHRIKRVEHEEKTRDQADYNRTFPAKMGGGKKTRERKGESDHPACVQVDEPSEKSCRRQTRNVTGGGGGSKSRHIERSLQQSVIFKKPLSRRAKEIRDCGSVRGPRSHWPEPASGLKGGKGYGQKSAKAAPDQRHLKRSWRGPDSINQQPNSAKKSTRQQRGMAKKG